MQREVLPQAGSQSRACQVRTVSWLPAHSKRAPHTQAHSAEKLQRPGPAGTRDPGRRQLGIEDVLCWRAQAHEWASCTYLRACESRGVGVFQCWSIGCVHAHVPCKAHGMGNWDFTLSAEPEACFSKDKPSAWDPFGLRGQSGRGDEAGAQQTGTGRQAE